MNTRPIYPAPYAQLLDELDRLLARIHEMVAECPPAFDGGERRA